MRSERIETITPSLGDTSFSLKTVETRTAQESFLSQEDAISTLKARRVPTFLRMGVVMPAGVSMVAAERIFDSSDLRIAISSTLLAVGVGGVNYAFNGFLNWARLERQIKAAQDNKVIKTDINTGNDLEKTNSPEAVKEQP